MTVRSGALACASATNANDGNERGMTVKRDAAPGFSDPDLNAWIDALRVLPTAPVTEADVLAWVEGPLRKFFTFEKFLGAYGNLSGGRIQMRSLVSSGHAPEFLAGLEATFGLKSRGCFAWWVANRRAFTLDSSGARDEDGAAIVPTRRELDEIDRFALGAVAAHGVIDPFANAGTYISFSGVPKAQPERTLAALNLIAPVLHTLFLLTKQAAAPAIDLMTLTDRQRELVDLALMGLSDKAIARRLSISDHTVGNHFRAIYDRLGISKRSQLIALLK
jgi:DNA-binding CsgD family transcriptional regulator